MYLKQLDETVDKLTTDFGLQVSSILKHLFQHNIRELYIDNLVSNLEERFADSDLLSSLVLLFHPSKAFESLQDSFSIYGDTAVTTVAAKFTTTVDKGDRSWSGWVSSIC